MKVLIVSGGEPDKEIVRNCRQEKYEAIIAVDKGIEILDELNIVPSHIIGDFDSVDRDVLNNYRNTSIEIHELNSEKDYTDTEMALKLAIELQSSEIIITGAIGNRIDHVLANIHLLKETLGENIECKIIDEHNEITVINKDTKIKKDDRYKYISLIPLTYEVLGLTLEGFKYPLENRTLKIGESIGISNEQTDTLSAIRIREGILIIIKSRDGGFFLKSDNLNEN